MSNTLKKITSKAKLLYKSGKYAKWTDAIKAASKGISTGVKKVKKVGSVKKKVAKKHTHYGKIKAHKRRVNGVTKSPARSLHKDTKSHNVRISVVSGIGNIGEHFTRINNDVNGNPRYVIHFFDVLNSEERLSIPFSKLYQYAIKKAKKIGGKKYDNKSYGGGIVFQSYNIENTYKKIEELKHTNPKIKI